MPHSTNSSLLSVNRVIYLWTCALDLLASGNTPDADWWPQVADAAKEFEQATKHVVEAEGYTGPAKLDPIGISTFIKARVLAGAISNDHRDAVIAASSTFEGVMGPLMIEAQDYT